MGCQSWSSIDRRLGLFNLTSVEASGSAALDLVDVDVQAPGLDLDLLVREAIQGIEATLFSAPDPSSIAGEGNLDGERQHAID